MISIIVAVDENNAIGYENKLLCHLPNDLKRFKKLTEGNVVVMGENTFLSLPKGALLNRTNFVLTQSISPKALEMYNFQDKRNLEFITPFYTFESMLEYYLQHNSKHDESLNKELFIIGGEMLYKTGIDFANRIYLTQIHHEFKNADTYFPKTCFSCVRVRNGVESWWEEIDSEKHGADEKHPYDYTFKTYQKNYAISEPNYF